MNFETFDEKYSLYAVESHEFIDTPIMIKGSNDLNALIKYCKKDFKEIMHIYPADELRIINSKTLKVLFNMKQSDTK